MVLPPSLEGRLSVPVIGAPMYIISQPALVLAQCQAGIVGAFPALNARPPALLDEWLAMIGEAMRAHDARNPGRPAAPFAVNQIVHKSNERLEADVELCVKYRVPIVITSLGLHAGVIAAIHAYGGIVLHDIVSIRHAHKAAEAGVDGLIAVAAGAGGHTGHLSPFALVQEIRSWWDGLLVLSGAIATGRAVLAAQTMGADLAYVGSAFIATDEANAAAAYKQAVVDGASADIVTTNFVTGVLGNYLRAAIARAGLDPDKLPQTSGSATSFGSSSTGAQKPWRDIWSAGQGIGATRDIVPAATRVERLAREYRDALSELARTSGLAST